MKIVVGEIIKEDIGVFCDCCGAGPLNTSEGYTKDGRIRWSNSEISFQGQFQFGYFSERDGDNLLIEFCPKCSNELYKVLKEKFKIGPLKNENDYLDLIP